MLAGLLGHEWQMSIDYCKDRLKASMSEGRKKKIGVIKSGFYAAAVTSF